MRTTDLVLAHDLQRRYVAASTTERATLNGGEARTTSYSELVKGVSSGARRAGCARSSRCSPIAAVVAGSLTLIATGQGRRAEREAAISAARELAAASIANLDDDAELAVLLAVEAVERSRAVSGISVPEAAEALHRAIAASRIVATIQRPPGPVATSVDGRIAAQAVDAVGRVSVLDAWGHWKLDRHA